MNEQLQLNKTEHIVNSIASEGSTMGTKQNNPTHVPFFNITI